MAETNSLLNCRTRLGYRGFESPLLRSSLKKVLFTFFKLKMFDFEKLEVYQLMKEQHNRVMLMLSQEDKMDRQIHDHWKNSMLLAVMNLVQASARVNNTEKKDLITISRGYIFECSSLLDLIKSNNGLSDSVYKELYDNYERISKMLLGMYKSFNGKLE